MYSKYKQVEHFYLDVKSNAVSPAHLQENTVVQHRKIGVKQMASKNSTAWNHWSLGKDV